jgi:hypothetical protein
VGGSHALLNYTGIVRETKDFDLFIRRSDLDDGLRALQDSGYYTEITFPHWLAKAKEGSDTVDLVFSSGNGICHIDDEWFNRAVEADVLGMPVKIAPVEELFWQKSFVMERERYDGGDLFHIIRACAEAMDWPHILDRYGENWQLLLGHLIHFGFIYPSERHRVPRSVMDDLLARLAAQTEGPASEDRVCRGTLVSRAQYLTDVGLYGYADARIKPRGNMSAEDCVYWTWAIANVK